MIEYIAFYLMAFLFTVLTLIVGTWAGTLFMRSFSQIVYFWMRRKLFIMGYHCFYPNRKAVEKDVKCQKLLQTARAVYTKGSGFNEYCTRISDERLPINVFMNWTRSVAEDIFTAQLPMAKLDQWHHYFKSRTYHRISFFYSDFPEYEDSEFGCLWGGVYFWLVVSFEKSIRDEVMIRVQHFGCKEKPAIPYFYYFCSQARNICGAEYHLPFFSEPGDVFGEQNIGSQEEIPNSISFDEILNGFESLSVNERCNARKVLNDLLADCEAWKCMRDEMKRRGWFKETIYPYSNSTTVVNGDIVNGDKIQEQKVFPNIGNFQPQIQNQNVGMPMPPTGTIEHKRILE